MRGDLQCNTIFFQPKGWKTAGRLHRSHKTIFNRFMEDLYCFILSFLSTEGGGIFSYKQTAPPPAAQAGGVFKSSVQLD